ncbi:ribonuclease H-like domain-containing protein [Tanacetum coccineum]
MHDPQGPQFSALKRILLYVRGTIDYGLELYVSNTAQLTAYTDADWTGCHVTHRSTSGYCFFLRDNLLSWSVKRQATLSRSSAEAEYQNVVSKTTWLHNLLCELHAHIYTTTLVYCDNVSVVYLSNNLVQHQHTKHIELDIQIVRDFVAKGLVCVMYVPSPLGQFLEEIRVTWAHLEKKWTRLRLYTNYFEEKHRVRGDGVANFKRRRQNIKGMASRISIRHQNEADLKKP